MKINIKKQSLYSGNVDTAKRKSIKATDHFATKFATTSGNTSAPLSSSHADQIILLIHKNSSRFATKAFKTYFTTAKFESKM